MNILVMGEQEDPHAITVLGILKARGVQASLINTAQFPQSMHISWCPNIAEGELLLDEGAAIKFSDIHSVYWRSLSQPCVADLSDGYQQLLAQQDSFSVLRTFLNGTPARWVNAWGAYDFHKEKPLQLAKVSTLGVKIPKTIVSNSPHQIQAFYRANPKSIYKPVYGGSHTEVLTDAHVELERLESVLRLSPITMQEFIPGTNIRTYVIGGELFSAEIRSDAVDFREDAQAQLLPLSLPASVSQQSLAIKSALGLEWTAIDWRRTPEGDYFFLEANPSPMFLHFEDMTGYPIAEKLVNLLMRAK